MNAPHPDTDATPVYPEHPADVTRPGGVKRNYASCQSHCCFRHGCKYGYAGCPVTTGQATQDHPCEQCVHDLEEAGRWCGQPFAARGEVGYPVIVAVQRTDDTDGAPLTGMPTDAHVAAKIAEALVGLDLDHGWTVTRVIDADTED